MPKNTLISLETSVTQKLWCLEITKASPEKQVTRIWAALKTCEALKRIVGGEITNTPIPEAPGSP